MGTVFEQEVVMRHPLAVLTAGILFAATSVLQAADGARLQRLHALPHPDHGLVSQARPVARDLH